MAPLAATSVDLAAASAASELIWCFLFCSVDGLYCASTLPDWRRQKLAATFTS